MDATLSALANGSIPQTLADQFILVSLWKPFVLLIPLGLWAWFITTVLDKHAARFHLGRQNWGMVHMIFGTVAFFVAVLAFPIPNHFAFLAAVGAMIVILAVDIGVYVYVSDRDERVPESHRIRFDMSSWREAKAEKVAAKQQGKVEVVIKRPDKSVLVAPDAETEAFAIRVAAESLYLKAIAARASQIDIAPTGKDGAYGVSILVDGVRQTIDTIPGPNAIRIIDFWKAAAGLDVSDRRRVLTADFTAENSGASHTIRLTTRGTQGGMHLTMSIDVAEAVRRNAEELGLLDSQMRLVKELVADGRGIVLLASPPDGGRTTTLYSILRMHDAYTSNVQTVESEIQDALEGVRQNRFNPQTEGAEYSTLVRSILRRDPDVVGVAELPDPATAKEISRADQERIRTYACLRADSALSAILMFSQAVGDSHLAADALRGAMAQRLVRRLCFNCRVPYQPPPDMLKKLGLPPDKVKQLFKKGGQVLIKNKPDVCPACNGVGYLGQIALFEVYSIGDEERRMIREGNKAGLAAALRKQGQPSIQQAALMRAVEGVTSIEEITRASSAPPQPPADAGPPRSSNRTPPEGVPVKA